MTSFKLDKKATIKATIPGGLKLFLLRNERNDVYFFRYLQGNENVIKFNICHPGKYRANCSLSIEILPLNIIEIKEQLPAYERNYLAGMEKFTLETTFNPSIKSPAWNYSKKGLIQFNPEWKQYPFPVRFFVLLHEIGHFFYETESKCDFFAAKKFLEMGYNPSTAYYSLTRVLNLNNSEAIKRINKLFNTLKNLQ